MARTITNPVESSSLVSSTIRTELQTLETEIANTTSGHDHDGTDSKSILAASLPSGINATKIANGSVTNTEFQYLGSTGSAVLGQDDSGTFTNKTLTSPKIDHIEETTTDHGVVCDGVTMKDGGALIITGGANTFNLTNGTGSLDVAAGKVVNIDDNVTVSAELHVEAATHVNQDLTSDASPTFTAVNATTFDTNVAAAGLTLAGTTLAADGTDAAIDITLTPKGTGDVNIGGDLALGANNLTMTGSIGATGARVTKLWATDIESTNAIAGSITGTAAKATDLVGGNNTTLLGSIPYQSNTDDTTLLAPNTTTTKKFLRETGDGTNGTAPAWDTIIAGDVPTLNQSTTGSAGSLKSPATTGLATLTGMGAGQTRAKTVSDADDTLMELGAIQSVTAAKTFDKDKILMKGTSTGVTTLSTANTGATSYTQTMQAKNGTIACQDDVTYIGTTSVALNRASNALTLAGITLTTPDIGTPSAGTLTNCTGYPAASTSAAGIAPQATAPAAGLYNYVGITNGETAYTNKALFDATVPETQAFGDSAATGSAAVAARRDHKHAMPAAEKDTTAITGVLKGNGSAISACSNLSDVAYLPLAGGTLTGDVQLGETDIKLDATLSGDEKWSGIVMAGTAGATLAVGDVCYLASSGKWLLNDGILDGTDTGFSKQLGICVLAGADTEPTEMLVYGKVRSAAFPAFTVGSPVYLSDTAGDMDVTQPSTTNFAIRVLGYAITAEDLLFNPSNDYIVHV
jgi:hypothetical protein